MSDIDALPPGCILIPAVMEGDAYRSALSAYAPGLKPIELDIVRSSLTTSHEVADKLVFWEGDYQRSTLLVHIIPSEGDYIVLDEEGQLLGSAVVDHVLGSDVTLSSNELLATTEGIWPEQRIPIATDYIESEFDCLNPSGVHGSNKATWSDLLLQSRCVILGPPGAGKTSLMRRLHSVLLEESTLDTRKPKPLYKSLRTWTGEQDIAKWLARDIYWHNEPRSGSSILRRGGVVVLLDGLDEVIDTDRSTVQAAIANLAESSPYLRIFVTCRDGAYDWRLFNFNHYAIRPFTWNEMTTWVSRYLGPEPEAVEFLSALRNNRELLSIAANPLALSVVAALYSRGWCTPTNFSKLLSTVVDIILAQWDGTRGVTRTLHPLSDPDNKRALLAELASRSFEMVSPSFAVKSLASVLKKLISVFKRSEKPDADLALRTLREHTGFIRYKGNDIWEFAEPAISDYFAARAFIESVGKEDRGITERLSESRWQKAWLVACGVTHDATGLMKAMISAKGLGEAAKTTLVLKGLGEAKMIEPSLYDECIRFVARNFENEMRSMEFDRVTSSRGGDDFRRIRVFNFSRKGVKISSDASTLRAAIFYLRKSDGVRQLVDTLGISQIEAVLAFLELLKSDGEYSERNLKSGLRCMVSRRLSPEPGIPTGADELSDESQE